MEIIKPALMALPSTLTSLWKSTNVVSLKCKLINEHEYLHECSIKINHEVMSSQVLFRRNTRKTARTTCYECYDSL